MGEPNGSDTSKIVSGGEKGIQQVLANSVITHSPTGHPIVILNNGPFSLGLVGIHVHNIRPQLNSDLLTGSGTEEMLLTARASPEASTTLLVQRNRCLLSY